MCGEPFFGVLYFNQGLKCLYCDKSCQVQRVKLHAVNPVIDAQLMSPFFSTVQLVLSLLPPPVKNGMSLGMECHVLVLWISIT